MSWTRPVAHLGVGLEDRQVHVAVAGVAAAGDQRAGGRGQLVDPAEVGGDGGPGDDHVDDVVGAGGLGRPERLLAGLDELGPGVGGQHVDVERAQLGQQDGQLLDVLGRAGPRWRCSSTTTR